MPVLVTINVNICECANFCQSYFSNAFNEYISHVSFSGIYNSTGGISGNTVDYTNCSATVQQGVSYTLSVGFLLILMNMFMLGLTGITMVYLMTQVKFIL